MYRTETKYKLALYSNGTWHKDKKDNTWLDVILVILLPLHYFSYLHSPGLFITFLANSPLEASVTEIILCYISTLSSRVKP